ncbi:MAG: AMP-binding protein [Selenomonadaceae bacterium]|nr:AMP-binding protein [Selenomonadaceae bacterium]
MLLHEILENGKEGDVALVDSERRLVYSELKELVKNGRNKLYHTGIRQGDRVAIFARNSIEFVCTYFAIVSLGAVAVPINFQLSSREIAYIIKNSDIEHIFTYKPLELDEYITCKPTQHNIKTFIDINDFVEDAPNLPDDFSDDNPCAIIYTSGTTGNPKGAVSSHRNLIKNVEKIKIIGCRREHKALCILPMYHCFGWVCSVLNPLYNGSSIFIQEVFVLKEAVNLIKTEQITELCVVPSICSLMIKLVKAEDISSLRMVISAGSPLPVQTAKDFIDKFGLAISEGYGLSEASPIITLNLAGRRKIGSTGQFIPDLEARFVDSDGKDVPQGHEGELVIRGDNIMLGYWNDLEATKEAIDEDGWLHTGDIAKIDEEGYVYIVNRLKDMIISMGENIYPREIEEFIYQFPNIKDAAVVGVKDSRRDEVGICFYSTQDKSGIDVAELRLFLQKNLALYKIPREFHELDELPRTPTGKISKRRLVNEVVGNL